MATQDGIITALGLDTTEYTEGLQLATTATEGFIKTINGTLSAIPIFGQVYASLVDGFSKARVAARQFQLTMDTDVSGSLEGTKSQLVDINAQLKDLTEWSTSRTLATGLHDLFAVDLNPFNSDENSRWEVQRQNQILDLQQKRTQLIARSVELYKEEQKSTSAVYAQSQKETELAALRLELATRTANIPKEQEGLFGPADSRSEQKQYEADQYGKERLKQINDLEDARTKEIYARNNLLIQANLYEQQSAKIAANKLPIDQAALNITRAMAELETAQDMGIKEGIDAANTKLNVAQTEYSVAVREKKLRDDLLAGETKLSKMRLEGANAYEVKLAEIKQKYLGPLSEAIAHNDAAQINALTSQQGDEQSSAATSYRTSGPQARAQARQEARTAAREARVTATQQREAVRAAAFRGSPMGADSSADGYDSIPTFGPDARAGVGTGVNPENNGPQPDPGVQRISGTVDQILQELRGGNG